jgi:hypothetical protein
MRAFVYGNEAGMLKALLRVYELLIAMSGELVLTTAGKRRETGWFIASGQRRQGPTRVTVKGRRV